MTAGPVDWKAPLSPLSPEGLESMTDLEKESCHGVHKPNLARASRRHLLAGAASMITMGLGLSRVVHAAQLPAMRLSNTDIDEDKGAGATLGRLSVDDVEGIEWSFNLVGDAAGMFALEGADIVVGSVPLDRQTAPAPQILVEATDGVRSLRRAFALNVRRPLPTLPLPAGAKIAFLGDSFIARGGYSRYSGGIAQGGQIYGRGLWGMLASMDPRFRIDMFATDNKAYPTIETERMDGAVHGIGGDRLHEVASTRPGYLRRLEDCLAREPHVIVIETAGGNNVGAKENAGSIIARLDLLLRRIRDEGVHAVVVTMPAFLSPAYPPDVIAAINAWLIAQAAAGRDGFRLANSLSIEGPGLTDEIWLPDTVHRGVYASWRVAKEIALPLLSEMVAAGSRFDLDPLANNVFPRAGTPGTGGTRTVASGNVANLSGVVATGMNIHRGAGSSLIACSKEVVTPGNERQVVTITPVNDGTAIHWLSYRDNTNDDIAAAAMGIDPQTDWGLEILWPVELDDWDGWDTQEINGGPASYGIVAYDAVSFVQAANSASYRDGLWLLPYYLQFLPGRAPTKLRLGRFGNPFALRWKSTAAGVGTAKIGSPIFRRIAIDPMVDWGNLAD